MATNAEGPCESKLPTVLNIGGNLATSEENASAPQDTQLQQHDYEAVLDMIGFGCAQWVILLVCGLLLMVVIDETVGMSIITIASQCDFATSAIDKAIMNASSFAGIVIFSYVWGYLSDTVGRRSILLYSTSGASLISVVSIFIPNYWAFVFMRFVVGVFIAGPSSTTYAYLGEFFTRRHCAIVANYASLFVGLGMAYVPAIAWPVLLKDWSLPISDSFAFRPWRLLTLFNLLPGFLGIGILLLLPDSPKVLLSLGKHDEALSSVNWICKRNTGKDLKQIGVEKLKAETKSEADRVFLTSKSWYETVKNIWLETRPLFHRPYALNFLICCTVMAGMFFSSTGMSLWFSEIQNRANSNTNGNHLTICELIDLSIQDDEAIANSTQSCSDHISDKSYIDSICLGLCFVVGYALLGPVINIFGRKATIIGSLLLSAVCCVLMLVLVNPMAIVICFILFVTMPGICISLLGSAVVGLVPTHLRGKAVCICFMLGRAGSIFGSNVIGALLASYCNFTFSFFAGSVIVCICLTMILPI
ncbi:PREDICTED: synaptic vesicle glycoprotein 2B [Rhagoletis zephyria]|uniref:synaptic vesicle glycoprotein 2B n=1 Tax=Rhagoletis zephyria TaxID=28612 RepID=UPI00081151FF|nr:PREDICTED: synaptic vesicle glycoprotein 2B [Rhagoletis zephyria]